MLEPFDVAVQRGHDIETRFQNACGKSIDFFVMFAARLRCEERMEAASSCAASAKSTVARPAKEEDLGLWRAHECGACMFTQMCILSPTEILTGLY